MRQAGINVSQNERDYLTQVPGKRRVSITGYKQLVSTRGTEHREGREPNNHRVSTRGT